MGKEIEVKIRNIDKKKIIEKVLNLGAKKVFSGRIIDYRFDTVQRDLSQKGKALRIRKKGKNIYLNLKGKKKTYENVINRREIGVRISNFKVMQRILNELGLIKIFELDKIRTEFKLENMKFDIDEYVGLDPILEIEGDSYENVQEYIKKLEIQDGDLGRMYIREIIAAKKYYNTFKSKKSKIDIRKL
jgi:predicted adenylyl cyclase CyaB